MVEISAKEMTARRCSSAVDPPGRFRVPRTNYRNENMMGKRGPKAMTGLRVLKGTDKGTSGPVPSERPVEPPAWLLENAAAYAEWQRLAPDLEAKKVLTFWDVLAFAQYCSATATIGIAERHLAEEGHVVASPVFDRNGVKTGERQQRNPWSLIHRDASNVAANRGARFGLSASERRDVDITDPGDESLESMLNNGDKYLS